ncbi:MAG: aspartate/glutamate racemase family protein [Pseudomonadota bacterium]|nr:aspartate/glutamate racemase family protein [Pseudomonadota bacterium]
MTPRSLGVLMLDTRFPRVVGDVGNPATFAFPVRYVVVEGASPQRVVLGGDRSLLAPFIEAARRLADEGVAAITTSCGFLVLFQDEMQSAVDVPVWTSSLLDVAGIEAGLPAGRRVGIVTVDADSLGPRHLVAAGAPLDTPTEGLARDSSFRRTLLGNEADLDTAAACDATVAAARRLVEWYPQVAAIVLECTNMPPYADAVRAATGLPVHDLTTSIAARFAALAKEPA